MLRYAVRALRKNPIFTAVTVLSLGLALALNTTLYALVDGIVHPYVPYVHPERVLTPILFGGDKNHPVPLAERARAVREGLHSADGMASWAVVRTMLQSGTRTEDGLAAAADAGLFPLLGLRPEVGRVFGATSEALVSYALWNRFFQGRPLDRNLKIGVGSAIYDVVGVLPRGAHFPWNVDVWIPLPAVAGDSAVPKLGPFVSFRLRPGVTEAAARRDVELVATRLAAEYHQPRPFAVRLSAVGNEPQRFPGYGFMLGIVTLVLLIACANLGTMMLARGMARRRELAIRIAIGAGRRDIVAEVLTECAIIVAVGLAIGFVLMLWALRILPHVLVPFVPQLGDLRPSPSWRVFAFAGVAAVATTLLAGAWPAWRAAGVEPIEPIKEGGTTSDRIRDRYNPLIIVEVALSTALLMASGLFMLFAMRLATFEFHFNARDLVEAGLRVPAQQMTDTASAERFFDDLLTRAAALPGVLAAATSSGEKPDGGVILSEEGRSGNRWMNSSGYTIVSPDYLRTFQLPVIAGRDFQPGDRGSRTGVAIVDEEAARRLFPDMPSPVGRMLKLGDDRSRVPWLRVVGVTRATEFQVRRDLDLPPEPRVYVLYGHDRGRERTLTVRGDGAHGYAGRAALALALRREIHDIAPWLGYPRVQPYLQHYDDTRSFTTFIADTLVTFGGFGLALCAVGLYGVLGYSVSRRLREFAIRTALGARTADVARVVLHDTAVTVLAGIGVGAFLGLWGTHGLVDALFVVHYEFAIALVAAEVLLVLVGAAACLGPLRRAVRADPVAILRAS